MHTSTSNSAQSASQHPKGLYVLFTAEMWERFNFYGMRALLTLFLVNALAYKESDASIYYGGFLGLGYLTTMLGGFISDRYLGNRNCILIGGTVMAIGQLLMFFSASIYDSNLETARLVMWAALGVITLGVGFFKGNVSSMVGQLYPKGDSRLDSAFTIFYMGINLGALLGITICPYLGDVKVNDIRDVTAFKWGFLAAAIAMLLGTLVFFFLKDKYVVSPDGKPVGKRPVFTNTLNEFGESEKAQFSGRALGVAAACLAGLALLFHYLLGQNWIYSFIYSSGLTLAGLILTDKSLTTVERDRIIVLYFVALFVMFFWACFEQAGSSLTFIADNQTDRHFLGWDLPPSLVQVFNSLFIIIFAFPFSFLWLWLQKRNAEPSSPTKQAIGLLLLALGFLIIAFQTKGLGNDHKLAVVWLILLYLLHTLGELCLSPIGLSLVSKLAPVRFSSLLMGVWFLANAAGYALAGTLGSVLPPTGDKFKLASENNIDLQGVLDGKIVVDAALRAKLETLKLPESYPQFAGFTIHNLFEFLLLFVILPATAGFIMLAMSRWLKKMMHGVH
jgi:POT family proton-dependent oligopeptide transporter